MWHRVRWKVIYNDHNTTLGPWTYVNQVPVDEDASEYLNRTYGPWGNGSTFIGRAVAEE